MSRRPRWKCRNSRPLPPLRPKPAIPKHTTLQLVDTNSGQLHRKIDAPYRFHGHTGLRFSADGKRLARSGAQGRENSYSVPIWSTETGEELFEILTAANTIAFSADGRLLAVGSSDFYEALSVWPLVPEVATRLPDPVKYPRIDCVEENTHYRGKKAAEFANQWKPAWGAEQHGLQYGVALTVAKNQFRVGGRVLMAAFVRNVSDKPQQIDLHPDMFWNLPRVTDSGKAFIKLDRRPLLGRVGHYRDTLEPGEHFGPLYLNFGLGENPRPGQQNWSPYWPTPALGKYQLTHSVSLKYSRPDASRDATSSDWSEDNYSSGTVEFEIVDGTFENTEAPMPATESNEASAVSESIQEVRPPAIAQTRFKRDGVLRFHDQQARYAALAFRPAGNRPSN